MRNSSRKHTVHAPYAQPGNVCVLRVFQTQATLLQMSTSKGASKKPQEKEMEKARAEKPEKPAEAPGDDVENSR